MKSRIRNIVCLLLLCMAWSMVTDTCMVPTVQAAMTPQQKAKAQREKEKAKKAKEREKAKAKAAKEREKAAKAKAKEKSDRSAVRSQTASLSDNAKKNTKLSYEEQVAEVEKWNAYVAEYMSRDITHSLDVWGQIGYSSLFTKTNYTPASNGMNAQGYQEKAKGYVGGGLGFGYQLRYQKLLVQTGLELQLYASHNIVYSDNLKEPTISREYMTKYQAPDGEKKGTVNYTYANMQDQLLAGYVQIPVMVGMPFYQNKLYFLVGPKLGIGVMGSSKLTTQATRQISDPELIGILSDMPNHGLLTADLQSDKQKMNWGFNLAASAELGGYVTNQIRLAMFVDYGLMNIQSAKNAITEEELPVANPQLGQSIDAGWNQAIVSSLQTSTARDAKVNPFLVGVKATMLFDLPRKKLKPMPIPKEPMPIMLARVVNADSGQPLAGIGVQMRNLSTGKVSNKTTNGQGIVNSKMEKGDYMVRASKQGYFPDSLTYALSRNSQDTLLLRLKAVPAPIIKTYCARVYARDTRAPLEAEVKISGARDMALLYEGSATEDGLFVTDLRKGLYITHLRYPGYMPLDDTVQFVEDTLSFYMTKIKEGIRVKINNLFFATGKTYILPESEAAMEDLAQFMLDNPSVNIRITGHTDSIGSDAANQILSEGRANSVRKELITKGVDGGRIVAEGKGESEPVDTNSTEEGRQNNRRVEFTITSTGAEDIKQIR